MYYLPYKRGKLKKIDLFSGTCSQLLRGLQWKAPTRRLSIKNSGIQKVEKKLGQIHQTLEKFLLLKEKSGKNSRLAPPFLPSHRPDLPAITDSPEGGPIYCSGGGQSSVWNNSINSNSSSTGKFWNRIDLPFQFHTWNWICNSYSDSTEMGGFHWDSDSKLSSSLMPY